MPGVIFVALWKLQWKAVECLDISCSTVGATSIRPISALAYKCDLSVNHLISNRRSLSL